MLKQILYNILHDLKSMPSRDEVLKQALDKKLEMSYNQYLEHLEVEKRYLLSRDARKVLKTINREMEREMKNERGTKTN